VEFSDFQCDYCIEQEKALREVIAKYEGQVRLIWKDYPEANANTASFQAARAARCADQQGRFWPYHDLLFANNNRITKDLFYRIAEKAGLDTDAFDSCYRDNLVDNLINDNIAEANILDINGIPFLYVNDQEVMGSVTGEDLDRMIKLELSKK
jgi:protein-disulfide isomerase